MVRNTRAKPVFATKTEVVEFCSEMRRQLRDDLAEPMAILSERVSALENQKAKAAPEPKVLLTPEQLSQMIDAAAQRSAYGVSKARDDAGFAASRSADDAARARRERINRRFQLAAWSLGLSLAGSLGGIVIVAIAVSIYKYAVGG